ncbi:MAG: DNA primase [Candidatus Omnitrophica bacterium]|nr:DNA primase [Candidatus Omnitrophota bacterium]
MPLIPDDVIDDIQARVDIAEVIGRYVPLKRAGRHFKAPCPFHKEKTPSFMVNTDKQIFHCFGCGVGGNIFSFLMQHDRLTFPEAVRQLADQAGVRLPETPRASTTREATEGLAALMDKVCRYFERTLEAPPGDSARAYLVQRGVSESSSRRFRLGLAPEGWDHLLKAAAATGVTAPQLESAGLVIRGTSSPYDRFRHRLIFPIIDVRQRVVGFGGRSLDGKEPKYLNSPETPLYTKGRHLFGLAHAKEAIASSKTAVVVEGYFDCVVLSDGGIANAVSPLGTALTEEQARLLKRYAERVILAFDADAAGQQATLRGIDVLVETGLQVHVAQLPQGVDPDEYLRANGRERFEQWLNGSVGIFEFLLQTALQRYPGRTVEQTVKAAQFVLPTIARIPDAILRSEYVRLLAGRLRLDEQAVIQELARIQSRGHTTMEDVGAKAPVRVAMRGPEALFVAMLLDQPGRWADAASRVTSAHLTDPLLQRALAVVAEFSEAEGQPPVTTAQVVSRLAAEGREDVVAALMQLVQSAPSSDEVFEDCLRRLEQQYRRRLEADKRDAIRQAQEAGRATDAQRLLAEYQQLVVAAKGG